ncbi:MAG: DUF2258 domain-containing protein [Archaeoglobaceae archaeon]
MRLSSGFVIVGAYADKIRRTLFAQLRDAIKREEVDSKEVARAAAELNRLLYELYVNRLNVDKGDVTRVRIDYEIRDSQIVWNYDTLSVEVFRRIPDEEVAKIVKELVSRAEEITESELEYRIEKVGETDLGDEVYYLYLGDEFAGAVMATPVNGSYLVRGAVTKPTAKVIDRTKVDRGVEESIQTLLANARNVEVRDALRVVNEIKTLMGEEEEEIYEGELEEI